MMQIEKLNLDGSDATLPLALDSLYITTGAVVPASWN